MTREDCSCFYLSEHHGSDAVAYADRHLEKVRDFDGDYRVEYVCPDHGRGWLFDYVGGTPHGGPTDSQARLRTLDVVRRAALSALRNVEILVGDAGGPAVEKLNHLLDGAVDPPRV